MHIDGDYINQYNNFGVNSLHNCYCEDSFSIVKMTFAVPVSGFGFFWGASDEQWILTAYNLLDLPIEAFALPITFASNDGDFVGLNNDPGIAYAILSGSNRDYIFLDNVTALASLPVPGPIAGAGLPGILFAGGGFLTWWRNRRSRWGSAALPAVAA
jgi:hypothetical protein